MSMDIPYNTQLVGIARQESEEITVPGYLLTGDYPTVFNTDEAVAPSTTIPALTIVTLGSDGYLKVATKADKAIGITIYDISTTADAVNATARICRGGVFNPDMLNWDTSFDSEAVKLKAFEGAPSPTQIVLRKPAWFVPDTI